MTAPHSSLLETATVAEDVLTGYTNALKAEQDNAVPAAPTTREDLMHLQSLLFEIHNILDILAGRPALQAWSTVLLDAAGKTFEGGLRLDDAMPPAEPGVTP